MSIINRIKYELYDQIVPDGQIPIIEVSEDGMAYGSVLFTHTGLSVASVVARVYRLAPPTTTEDRWSRLQPDLYTTACLYYTWLRLSNLQYKITWRFDPSQIPGGTPNGSEYSIEFFTSATPEGNDIPAPAPA